MVGKFCGEEINEKDMSSSEGLEELNDNQLILDKKTSKEKTIDNNIVNSIQKCCFISLIVGIVGVALFIGIVIVGIIGYGKVYLFNGYTFTKVLSIISIVLMLVGLCGVVAKCVFYFGVKIGKFPSSPIKRILICVLAVACLGFSTWGFVDCGEANKASNSSTSSPSSTSSSSVGDMTHSMYCLLYIKVSNVRVTHSGNYAYIRGTVTNTGTYNIKYVKVKIACENWSGKVIDTDWTYAVGSSWLEPGESNNFECMVKDEYRKISNATVTVIYD